MIWWFLIAALPLDPVGDPLPRYSTPTDVAQQLRLVEPALHACGVTKEHTQGVSLKVHGDGSVHSIVWDKNAEPAPRCWTLALESHRFRAHDDVPIQVSTTVYVRDGQLMLSPQPEVVPRHLGPLMLFVLPEAAEPVYEYLHGRSDAIER
jgi:hypothetical protein